MGEVKYLKRGPIGGETMIIDRLYEEVEKRAMSA